MTVTLPASLESFVSQKIASGLYDNADEVVVESLGLMRQQERWKATASVKINEGLRDLNEGRVLTDEQSRGEMAAFKARWRAGA
ncbi:type II toxin-antitoxin system ParD family antitoxin [Prosthecobacter sp.]|jgi:putative addiction module CopG family antidote|uniref:type II toxin-antitoxin system ParD family antitoxin n=1 Tax=Prosthecobacter sp. TaxID=1965333 RepID=UPI00378479AD